MCLLGTDVSAEHLPVVVSCSSTDQTMQLGQKQQCPNRQQPLPILLISCKTDQPQPIHARVSCVLWVRTVGLLLQIPNEGHNEEALTSKVSSVVRTVQDQ